MATDKSSIVISGSEATWSLKAQGDINGTYLGKFKFKCFLTPLEKIAANKEYRQLLGDNMTMAPEHESFLAYALTQLKYRIIEAPPFWNTNTILNGDLADDNIISEVLDAAITAEVEYRTKAKKKKEKALGTAKKAAEAILDNKANKEDDDE